MSLQAGRVLTSLLVTCVIACQGLDVTFDRTPESQFCGQLRCEETVNQADPHISYIMGLSIHSITSTQTAVKLASVSLFDPALYIDPSKVHVINGTGSITTSRGHLALSFQDVADCLHATFLCQLDFVNVSGQPDTVTESSTSGDTSVCGSLAEQVGVLSARLDNLTSDIQVLKHESTVLQDTDQDLQRSLDNVTQILQLENTDLHRSLDNVTHTLKQETTLLQNKNLDLQRSLDNVTQILRIENMYLQRTLDNATQALRHENLDLQSALDNVTQILRHENLVLQSALENIAQRLAMLEAVGNSSINTTQVLTGHRDTLSNLSADDEALDRNISVNNDVLKVLESTCSKGMSSDTGREEFLLWGRVPALCDTETDGGRWVIIQRRTRGDVDFYRNWADYKNGFGTPKTDFWIGLDVIHNLTSKGYNELRFDLQYEGKNYFQLYSNFHVSDELSKYRLSVAEFTGTAGDSFSYNNGRQFSTSDSDNDLDSRNCASLYRGAWWHYACSYSNLNGQWAADGYTGFQWRSLGGLHSLDSTEMKVRQV